MIRRLRNLKSQLLDSIERRFRRARPGSVLILVVALLVLLALLGTAYINTAQSDRYSSSQNSFNTEVELLLQGLENVTQGTVANGLFNAAFHQDSTTTPAPQLPVGETDYPLNKPSAFLADRYPTVGNLAAGASNNNPPLWQFLSTLPLVPQNGFESPYSNSTGLPYPTPPGSPANYKNHTQMYPTSVSWQVTDSSGTHTVTYPALAFQVFVGNPPMPTTYVALAADTDGDGIADAALFRLPIGELNGITYYGAVRIVDNCAAVNAAIAWMPNVVPFVPSAPALPGEFFPTNIDLYDLVMSSDQGSVAIVPAPGAFTNDRTPGLNPTPYDDSGTQRTDFAFASPFEAFWMQVGRRLGNPGYSTPPAQYAALPISEMATMGRHFIIRDPGVTTAASSSSILERDLPNSVFNSARTSAYAPTDVNNWYTQNFDFANGNIPVSLRSMLVTQNGVSNFTYSKLHSTGTTVTSGAVTGPGGSPGITSVTAGGWNVGTKYNFGDWVTNTDSSSGTPITRSYVCMQQTVGQSPPPVNSTSAYWEVQPWATGPTKASANTATFGQLWTAYYSAMTETPLTATSVGTVTAAAHKAMFRSSLRTVTQPNWDPGTNGEVPNPLPATGPTGPAGFPELQLRAAIAAINTLQLRNPNSASPSAVPLSATINLTDATGALAYKAVVYGSAPQPYITEVYASTMGTNPYVAVELYNPYPFAIPLTGWQLAFIPRTGGASLTAPTLIPWVGAPPTVPATGFVTLVTVDPDTDMPGGPSPTGTKAVVPTLATALGNELVLLRPGPAGASPLSAGVSATIPVDSYDFSGLTAADPTPGHDWHYIRPNDPSAGKAWHFVYPGPLTGSGNDAMHPREVGTKVQAGPTPQITSLAASFGVLDPAPAVQPTPSQNSYIDRPLQINNTSFGGPNKATASGNTFPYGGFARNADLLQVTYVGAYQITDTAGNLLELNALPADSAMADDFNHLSNDPNAVVSEQLGRQNIGRFCPVNWADTLAAPGVPAYPTELAAYTVGHPPMSPPAPIYVPDDYWTQDSSLQTGYHWAFRLFDYITVQSPQDDYLPDVDPAQTPTKVYPGPTPQPVANVNAGIANASITNKPASATEETVPVHGRININTATWRVLATLPFFDNPYNANAQSADNELARAIVYYRDVDDGSMGGAPMHPHGAFQTIGELNNVPVTGTSNPLPTTVLTAAGTTFRNAFGQYYGNFPVSGQHGSNIDGDLSPNAATVGADQVYGDFENQNLALNRISNLITTRSDSFTAYIIVQGWRNAGTPNPQLVVQRRAAFIIDRSTLTAANNTQPAITNVPY